MIKFKQLDILIGFSLALLAAMPVLRLEFPIPSVGLVLPIIMVFGFGVLKIFTKGSIYIRSNIVAYFYFILLLFVYLLTSAIWNPFDVSVGDAVLKIILIIIAVVSVIISFNERAAIHFINWIIFFSVFAAATLFLEYIRIGSFSGYRLSSTLVRPQLMGIGAIFSVSKLLFFNNIRRKQYIGITGFLLLGLAFGGARGALIITFVICMLLLGYYFYINNPKSFTLQEWLKNKSLRIASVSSIVLMIIAALQIERTAHKMRRLFFGGELLYGDRTELWIQSFLNYLDSPIIGHGLRSSGVLSNGDSGYYPHNLFLEVLLDGGIIAFFLLIIVCFYPIIRVIELYRKRRLNSMLWLPIMSGYIFLIMEFSKSNSLYEARMLFVIGIVLLITTEKLKK